MSRARTVVESLRTALTPRRRTRTPRLVGVNLHERPDGALVLEAVYSGRARDTALPAETLPDDVREALDTLWDDETSTRLDVDLDREPACEWGKGGTCDRPARWQHSWRHVDDGAHPGMLVLCPPHHAYSRMLFGTSTQARCSDPCGAVIAVVWRRL